MTRRFLEWLLAFMFGGCCALGLLVLAEASLTPAPEPPRAALAFEGPALTADHLAAKVAVRVREELVKAKPEIVANAGGWIQRQAVRSGFPIAEREVPTFTRHGIDAALEEFGNFSVGDLVKLLDDAAKESGRPAGRLVGQLRAEP